MKKLNHKVQISHWYCQVKQSTQNKDFTSYAQIDCTFALKKLVIDS